MKKLMLIGLILCGSLFSSAQLFWQSDLERAKSLSASTGKLIVIDFWASWCGPCQKMENELWDSEEIKSVAENFIPVKINIDFDRATAREYSVTAIPKLVIAISSGEVLWEKLGYSDPDEYIKIISALPKNSSALFEALNHLSLNEKNPELQLITGIAFQKTGKTIPDFTLREVFFTQAIYKFRKAVKFSHDPYMKQRADLYEILLDVYRNKPQKAMKNIAKIQINQEDTHNAELLHFIQASCYKAMKDDQGFQKEKALIKSEEFLTELGD